MVLRQGIEQVLLRGGRYSVMVFVAALFLWLCIPPQSVSAVEIATSDCRSCHGSNLSTRHHLLISTAGKMCLDCHELYWDYTAYTWKFSGTHECKTCHTTTLADRHHVLLQHSDLECFTCHAVEFDETVKAYYINFNYATAREQTSHYFNHIMLPNDCSGCHLNNLVDEHDQNCYYCHASADEFVKLAVRVGYRDCNSCHSLTFKHLSKCGICHAPLPPPPTDIASLHRRHMHRVNCGYCHMVKESYELNTAGLHCSVCHTVARPYLMAEVPSLHKIHVKGRGFFPYACYMCHGKSTPQMHPDQCSVCHEDDRLFNKAQLQTIHRTHAPLFDCTNCHFDPMDFMMYTSLDSCVRCHEARTYTTLYSLHGISHKDKPCWACHPADELLAERSEYPIVCVKCHGGNNPPSYSNVQWVHYRHNNYQCWSCHTAIYPICPSMKQPMNAASGSVAGLTTDTNGLPLKGVRVFTQGGAYLTLSRINGAYALRYLPPGYYRLVVEYPGYVTKNMQMKINNGQTTAIDIALTPVDVNMASITGQVMDASMNAVSGAVVKVGGGAYSAVTAPDGVFTITSVPVGRYTIDITKIGFASSSTSVDTVAGQAATASVSLTGLPQEVVCSTCHAIELLSKISCMNKKWKAHYKDARVGETIFNNAEIQTLGKTCRELGYWMGATALYEEASAPLSEGNLTECTSCHVDFRPKVNCDNPTWRTHLRKEYVGQATNDLAEKTYLGGKCN